MLLVVIAFAVGVAAGVLANVPIDRWPRSRTVGGFERAPCSTCGARRHLAEFANPATWVRPGRCPRCGAAGSPREPAVIVACGTLTVVTALTWGADLRLGALLVLAWSLVVAATIDIEHRIIPNRLTLRLPIALLVLLALVAVTEGAWTDLRRGVLAALVVPAGMLALSETYRLLRGRVGIGMGDIKLAVSIGLVVGFLGAAEVVIFLYAAMFSAVAVTLVLLLSRRVTLASRIPFGPYLSIGALLPVVGGDVVTSWIRTSIVA